MFLIIKPHFHCLFSPLWLSKGDMQIGEIVQEVGLSSRSYFSKIFKEKYGVLPREILKHESGFIHELKKAFIGVQSQPVRKIHTRNPAFSKICRHKHSAFREVYFISNFKERSKLRDSVIDILNFY